MNTFGGLAGVKGNLRTEGRQLRARGMINVNESTKVLGFSAVVKFKRFHIEIRAM